MLLSSKAAHDNYSSHANLIAAWKNFLAHTSWQQLINNVPAKKSNCGIIYELPNYLNRYNEGFAIADMRDIAISEPHYHTNGETEIYFILQGTATIIVGTNEYAVQAEDVIIIDPNKAHFTVPDDHLIMAIVNTPPFNSNNYIILKDTNESVGFYREQFEKFAQRM